MLTHTNTFKDLAKAPVKTSDVVVARQIADPYGYFDDVTAIWTSRDVLMSANIDAVGTFLGTTTKKAVVKLIGVINGIEANQLFQIRLGLYNNDPSVAGFDYMSEGFYLVDNVAYDYDSGSTTITMYDHMWTAQNTSYTDTEQSTGFSYPTTVMGLASQMAAAIGITLMTNFAPLPNSDYMILVDPYATIQNATLATVIQEIAQATGTTARITDTTLVFSTAGNINDVV